MTYDNNRIKQFHMEEFIGSFLDANVIGESMLMNALRRSIQNYSSYIENVKF